MDAKIRIGTAGWSVPRAAAPRHPPTGTHLERYSRVFGCVEINSSFYRPHAVTTYAKWRDQTPPHFRFAVKLTRAITHELRLRDAREPFAAFLAQTAGLAEKRGPILVQLPPSLAFDSAVAVPFLTLVRDAYQGPLVCEPRHQTWFSPSVASLLASFGVSTVVADPAPVADASVPVRPTALVYFRWHGSPRVYWSRYGDEAIASLATQARTLAVTSDVWCIFDNTASGAAIENAWELHQRLVRDVLFERGTE